MNNKNTCYVCQKKQAIFLFKKVNKFNLVKCKYCKIIYVKKGEIPKRTIANFYNKFYFNNNSLIGYSNYHVSKKAHKKNAIKLLSRFQTKSKNNLLDYGCGYGYLLEEAEKKGINTYGIEHSNHARKICLRKNLKVFKDHKFFIKNKIKFNFIFIIGTIEHLIDPRYQLKIFSHLLKKNGKLIITTIDTEGYFPLYKLKPPEHTFYFSNNNLKILLKRYGFINIEKNTLFSNFLLFDLFHRLSNFFNSNIFRYISHFTKKFFPQVSILIPTNEMCVIAQKK